MRPATKPQGYQGVLFIGDPHLASRVPGFRKDDYPRVTLEKLRWTMDFARQENLLPVILGDLFDRPRDNANWLVGETLAILRGTEVYAIYGNHDCRENDLGDDDTVSILVKSGFLKLLGPDCPWRGLLGGQMAEVHGVCWGQKIPRDGYTQALLDDTVRFVVTHHDIHLPGYEEGRLRPFAIEGVAYVINGHIHRNLEDVLVGDTRWMTPGNISRISRSDANRSHKPSVLRALVTAQGVVFDRVEVPHAAFEEVFHKQVISEELESQESVFVRGLADLQARKTQSGAGLMEFLNTNLEEFEPEVAEEIRKLAAEVLEDPTLVRT